MRGLHPVFVPMAVLAILRGGASAPLAAAPRAPLPSAAAAQPAEETEARALLESVLKRHAAFRDFEARFTETAVSRATGPGQPEAGRVLYRRPGLWRWEYDGPERKIVLVRAGVATLFLAGEDGPVRQELDVDAGTTGIADLLSGGEGVLRAFKIRFDHDGGASPEEQPLLRLEPLRLSEAYAFVVLRIRRRDRSILEAAIVDPGGNRLRFRFDGLTPDRGIPEGRFDPIDVAPRP